MTTSGNGKSVSWQWMAITAVGLLTAIAIGGASYTLTRINENEHRDNAQGESIAELKAVVQAVVPSIDKRLERIEQALERQRPGIRP